MDPWFGAILQDLATLCNSSSGNCPQPKQNNQNLSSIQFWSNPGPGLSQNQYQDTKMSGSSSSSDSEGSSSGSDEMPQMTTKSERMIRKYQIKKSLIQERIFAIDQVFIILFYR